MRSRARSRLALAISRDCEAELGARIHPAGSCQEHTWSSSGNELRSERPMALRPDRRRARSSLTRSLFRRTSAGAITAYWAWAAASWRLGLARA